MSKLIAKIPTFTKAGRYVERGQLLDSSEIDYVEGESDNVIEAPSGVEDVAVVEISAIAPTGPNPQNPQQLPIGAHQTPAGYVQDGARLVGEVTNKAEQRFEIIDREADTQALVTEALENADNNVDNAGTEGTVADVSARAADLDADGLDQLEKAENDREVPRKGVLSAIEKRRAELATA